MTTLDRGASIYLAGHTGLVGSAILRRLQAEGYQNLVVRDVGELDLTEQAATRRFFAAERPDAVIIAAAKVGGILANWEQPWAFIEQNLLIELNVIGEAFRHGVQRLIFLGSSCIYPREAPQPLREEYLLTGPLEETNRAYAIAKIAGVKLAQAYRRQHGCDFISAMPTNLYGPGDNFDLATSHVLPALIRKAHEAKVRGDASITIWGTGKALREFLHVDDCAAACVLLMKSYSDLEHVNVGSGEDTTIQELTKLVCDTVGFRGKIVNDLSKPDGTPRKLMSAAKIRELGWKPQIRLVDGLDATYRWFLNHAMPRHAS